MPHSKKSTRQKSLELLREQKATVLNHIARIKRAIKEKTISFHPLELECRLDILNSYIEQAMTYQSEIDVLDSSNDERAEVEDLCVSTKCLLLGHLTPTRRQSFNDTTVNHQTHHNSRLPNMKLPKFSGKYSEYKNFISLFESLVDNDLTLTEIEKFNHLISCLSDEALGTVKAYQITDQNYSKALASLKKVYDNPCLIFFDDISRLFDLPEMTKPSATALRNIVDTVSAIYDSLLSIGDEKSITNAIIIHLVMSKVDVVTRTKWEEQLNYEKLPLWSDCESALNRRYQHISASEAGSLKQKLITPSKIDKRNKKVKSFSCQAKPKPSTPKCIFCGSFDHYVSSCISFAALSVQQRFEFIKGVPACINCLRKGHTVTKCTSSKCRVCNRSHNTLLHQYTSTSNQVDILSSDPNQPSTSSAFVNHFSSSDDNVILATALVKIKDRFGQYVLARALLDSGSQINFVTEELSQRLQLQKEERNLNLIGIGKSNSSAKYKLQATVKSRLNPHEFSSDFWILRSISKYQPDQTIYTADWNIPNNIELADPYFFKSQKIDMLIGAEIFFELLCIGQIKKNPYIPTLQKTLLGWIVSGKYSKSRDPQTLSCHLVTDNYNEGESSLDKIVQKFWELEEIPVNKKVFSTEQLHCEENFLHSVKLVPSGRFQVSLPFKGDPKSLGDSFSTAKRRFLSLERRLSKNIKIKGMYNNFMKEYLTLGHMSITDGKIPINPHYFIPHQCVLRPQSSSTKLRVVFDASCKTSSQVSLNDLLMIGPTIQEELYSILIRFRLHKYVLTADIEKMYRQVLVDEASKNFQLILWRAQEHDDLKIYKLNTVTYGTSSAPFLAIRSLLHLGDLYKDKFPLGSQVIRRDFYVDDLLTGADSIEELETIRSQVNELLKSAGFHLTKWVSNYNNADKLFKEKTIENDEEVTRALGIRWLPKDDIFEYQLEDSFQGLDPTKRNILSVAARLFDPLGLLCPLVIKAKVLLQELWLQKLDWDEPIPIHLIEAWNNFKADLLKINTIHIPRYVLTSKTSKCQIHGFSDASIRAYGCCIYVRSRATNNISCRLLTAKSKVAPLKTKSLPRLELCAAQLLAKLWAKIKNMLSCEIESVNFWTDSEITLHWIQTHPSTLATFVSNRVSEIQDCSTGITWRHVPTKENPADIVSRGSNVSELVDSTWFTGPEFLLCESTYWPKNKHFTIPEDEKLLEKRKINVFLTAAASNDEHCIIDLIGRQSIYSKLIRIVSYILRFVHRCRKSPSENCTISPAKEMRLSFLKLIEIIQKYTYSDEFRKLENSQTINVNLQKLNPFIHNVNEENRQFSLIRVGGRLLNASVSFEAKFPLLMPKRCHFMTLYLRDLHLKNYHAGAKAMVALLRDQIWLINAKEECNRIVRKCVHCFKYKPKLMNQIMGNLPADRVRALRPFKICGVDFCGPVNVTLKIRGRPPIKMYIAVFVCFTSKAVHLELVSDLTSNAFILSFKRFVARRGQPTKVYADNATNFVGASRELREARKEILQQATSFAASIQTEFVFIPPRAPHFGGLWEAAVKSAKGLLLRTVGTTLLTVEELSTILAEIEAVLNSRPIAPLSSDPNDGEALTPGHLLIGESLRALPSALPTEDPVKLTSLKRWQLISALKRTFWRSWVKDYVLGLQIRTKWPEEEPDVAVGRVVVVHEDNLTPLQWLTGVITAVVQGQDGKVRVAQVRTKNGTFKRPITKLALLPID